MAASSNDAQQPVVIGEVCWSPTPEVIARSRLRHFMDAHGIPTFEELVTRANADPAWFWDAAVKDLGIHFFEPYHQVLDTSNGIEWATWFRGGSMNAVASCLDQYRGTPTWTKPAIIAEDEQGEVRRLTYAELDSLVSRCASGLLGLGLQPGDRVGLYMPLTPEVAVAALACARAGLVFVPLFSGYGPDAIVARMVDSGARALICADGYYRRGNLITMKETADAALENCPEVEHLVVWRALGRELAFTPGRDHDWQRLLAEGDPAFPTARLDPETPVMIVYTSGTTGRPKGVVHVHCGFPVKTAQDLAHCFDMGAGDTLFWVTDIGWMMGPWLIFGSLINGGTMVLYSGTPDYPGPDRVWRVAADHGATILGISPTLVRGLMPHGDQHVRGLDLSRLRILGGTGEPWNPEPFLWYHNVIGGGRLPIINYSGGTEIAGGILAGNPLRPIRPCSLGGPTPGVAADVVDEAGNSLVGQVGELAIRGPWPGMTRGFWNDRERYLETYWSKLPGIWIHGDWAYIDPEDGLWYVLGRSDDTIKVAGKRLGPAEVESVLVEHPAVAEAAAIGVPDQLKGEALVCFVVTVPGVTATDRLATELQEMVTAAMGKALRPKAVLFVSDLPKTRNAKVMRRVIRAVYTGRTPGDVSSLDNPAALEAIRAVSPV